VVLNPSGTGTIVDKITSLSGSDEFWYDPVTGDFCVTGVDAFGNQMIAMIAGASYALLQSIDLTGPERPYGRGDIFVPLEGAVTNTLCLLGASPCSRRRNPAACQFSSVAWQG
jgi:hypothetical protein